MRIAFAGTFVAILATSACGARTALLDGSSDAPGPADASPGGVVDAAFEEAAAPAVDSAPAVDAAPACPHATGDAGACNALTLVGPPVHVVCDPSPPPTPVGGLVTDGTYVLVSSRFHGACPGAEGDRITWNVCGRGWSTVQEGTTASGTTTERVDGDAVVSATTVTVQPTCAPSSVQVTAFGFDATPATLVLYVHGYGPGTVRVDSFERQ